MPPCPADGQSHLSIINVAPIILPVVLRKLVVRPALLPLWLRHPVEQKTGRGERGREEGTGNRGVANRGVAEKCCSSPPTFRLYKGCQSVATSVAAQHGQWNVEKASATGGQDAQDGETRCLSVCTAVDVDVQ